MGFIIGAATKIISNVVTGEEWNSGVLGAAVGGATYGIVVSTTGNIALAGYLSAAAESVTNEAISYIPLASTINGESRTRKITGDNVINSVTAVISDTIINGTLNTITGKVASKIIPTNNGWFKPRKFTSSFAGKYAIKAHLQTVIQGIETFAANCYHYQGMQSIYDFWRK